MNTLKNIITKIYLLVILTLIITVNNSYCQSKADKIDKLMSTYNEYGNFNGSLLVAQNGKILYKKGFGLANMEWDIPNQVNTKHRLGSITKLFTSMLIVQLASEGKINLDSYISTYLPNYPKPNGDIITIKHLLSHTSGIPNYTESSDFRKLERNELSKDEMLDLFANEKLNFKPGEKYEYSNSGFNLLGIIIEKITGKSYEQVLTEKILSPIKMNNTGYDNYKTILKNRAKGYQRKWNHRSFVNSNFIDMSIPFSAGAIYSTVEDLFLWDNALYTEELLSKKYMNILFDSKDDFWEMPIGNTNEKVLVTGHTGGINGFYTLLTRVPSNKSFIILLNNTGYAPLEEMTKAINGILHNKPYDLPKKSIAFSLFDEIEKNGIDSVLSHYNDIKDSNNTYIDEKEMNNVGYQLMLSNREKEAEVIFKLNTEIFQNSWNAYDSYGEVLMTLGNKIESIKNYSKSFELNPQNDNAVKMLNKLKEL